MTNITADYITSNGGRRGTYPAVEIGGSSNIISNVDASYAVSEGGIEMVGDEDSLTNITADYDFGYGISISSSHDNVFSNIICKLTLMIVAEVLPLLMV